MNPINKQAYENSSFKIQSSDKTQNLNSKTSVFDLEERMAQFGEEFGFWFLNFVPNGGLTQ